VKPRPAAPWSPGWRRETPDDAGEPRMTPASPGWRR